MLTGPSTRPRFAADKPASLQALSASHSRSTVFFASITSAPVTIPTVATAPPDATSAQPTGRRVPAGRLGFGLQRHHVATCRLAHRLHGFGGCRHRRGGGVRRGRRIGFGFGRARSHLEHLTLPFGEARLEASLAVLGGTHDDGVLAQIDGRLDAEAGGTVILAVAGHDGICRRIRRGDRRATTERAARVRSGAFPIRCGANRRPSSSRPRAGTELQASARRPKRSLQSARLNAVPGCGSSRRFR